MFVQYPNGNMSERGSFCVCMCVNVYSARWDLQSIGVISHAHIYMRMYAFINMHTYIHTYIPICILTHTGVCMCVCVCEYACIYTYIYIYILCTHLFYSMLRNAHAHILDICSS